MCLSSVGWAVRGAGRVTNACCGRGPPLGHPSQESALPFSCTLLAFKRTCGKPRARRGKLLESAACKVQGWIDMAWALAQLACLSEDLGH